MPKDTGSLHVSRRSPALARSLEKGLSLVTSKTVSPPVLHTSAVGLHGPLGVKHRQRNTPATSRPAFLSGTEQYSRITVETGACRLNDSLKGLWSAMMGEGRNRRDSTLVGTMA
jgi:hypothetical protein